MNIFTSIKELLSTLVREHKLLTEMFEKRKTLSYKYDLALEMVDYNEDRIQYLITHSVVRQNGSFLEIDDQFLQFFEQVLEVNEEINTSSINSNIQNVKENILYYLKENNESRKYDYLRKVKNALRKIGNITLRNVVDLKRNIDNTFKNEPNYKVKKAKLENLDKKRIDINSFIDQTYKLISEEEQSFFKSALDDELNQVITYLKLQLNECRHNLIEIQKQIIEYLNQIKYQSGVIEKLRQLKYLKDQFTIRAASDIDTIILKNDDVIFEANRVYPLKLSLDYLQSDNEAYTSILKVANKIKTAVKLKLPIAGTISSEYLNPTTEEEIQINLEEVRNSFLASENNLFDLLVNGEKIPASKIKHSIVQDLISEGIIHKPGKRKSTIQLVEKQQLKLYLQNHYAIKDLHTYIDTFKKEDLIRAELVSVAADSKIKALRTFKGFLVNCYSPTLATLNGQAITISPTNGTFNFIYDFESFIPQQDITIVGIENPENFRYIDRQKYLFQNIKPLFVSRYPQNQSKDLIKWLQSIPNNYLHFGDFDFAGIGIYLNEFKKHLDNKAKFFSPENIDNSIKKSGSKKRYDEQKINFDIGKIKEEDLLQLLDSIHRHKKGLDQEIFINE